NGVNACWVLYTYSTTPNTLQLANDAATGFSSPINVGSGSTLSNSQCTVSATGASATVAGNSVTVNVPLSFSPNFAGAKTVYGLATDVFAQNSAWQTVGSWTVPAPDFTVSVTAVSGTALVGGSTTYTVAVNGVNGFSGAVALSATSLPAGISTASFNPATITGSGTSTLTLSTAQGSPAGNYSFTVTGNATGLSPHSGQGSLIVQDYILTVSPSQATINANAPGNVATFTVTATPINGYSGTVVLAWSWGNYGSPLIGSQWTPSSHSIILDGVHQGSATYVVTASGSANSTWSLTIYEASSSCSTISNHCASASLAIGSYQTFSLSLAQSAQTIASLPGTASYAVTVNSTGGFAGNVNFSVTGLPSGASMSPASTYVSANGTVTANLAITAGSGAAAGSFPLTITGTSASQSQLLAASLAVQVPQTSTPANLLIPPSPAVGTNLIEGSSYPFQFDSGSNVSEYSMTIEAADDQTVCTPSPYRGPRQPLTMQVSTSCCTRYRPLNVKLGSSISNAWQYQSYGYVCGIRGNAVGISVSCPGCTGNPPTGTGSSQSFTATYSDPRGAADISQASLMIQASATSGSANQCIMRFDRAANNLYLLADDGVTSLGPIAGGGYDTLANSQCAVTGGYNVVQSGNSLAVDFSVIFTTSFVGVKQLFLSAVDGSGYSSATLNVGSWTVPIVAPSGTGPLSPASPAEDNLPTPVPPQPVVLSSPTVQNCSDISGTWSDPNFPGSPGATWTLNQSGYQILGSLQASYTGDATCTPSSPLTVTWNSVVGTFTNGSTAHVSASNPSPSSFTCTNGSQGSVNNVSVDVAVDCPIAAPSNYNAGTPNPPLVFYPAALTTQAPALSWTRKTYPPALALTFDIKARQATVTLTGPPGKTSGIAVSFNGNSNVDGSGGPISTNIATKANASVDQSGTTSYPLYIDLTSLPFAARYTSMTATWADETLQFTSIGNSRAPDITTLGLTRFSKYNTADEKSCQNVSTATGNAYVFSGGGCSGAVYRLNAQFIQQASLNGGGFPQDSSIFQGQLLKTFGPSVTPKLYAACSPTVPPGFTLETGTGNGNIFALEAPPDMGACGKSLQNAKTLAVYPGPGDTTRPHWNCSDSVMLLNPGNTPVLNSDGSVDLKVVLDTCPDCRKDYGSPNWPGTVAHIDMYTSDKGCGGHSFANSDWRNYYPIRIK
ncbi:MAG: hypothetical protein C5B51_01805, partial [Terriglobia bacterium]